MQQRQGAKRAKGSSAYVCVVIFKPGILGVHIDLRGVSSTRNRLVEYWLSGVSFGASYQDSGAMRTASLISTTVPVAMNMNG